MFENIYVKHKTPSIVKKNNIIMNTKVIIYIIYYTTQFEIVVGYQI